MDREYFLRRQYEGLERARTAASGIAKQAHQALAKAFMDVAEGTEQPTVVQLRLDKRPRRLTLVSDRRRGGGV